jgi:TolB-like protein
MPGQNLAFGPFVLDPDTGTLLRQGVPVPVGYRAALLLAEMLRRPGDVLAKSELLDAGWRGMAVEEGNLSVQIAALRRLLGPAPDGGDWIATVPRVGYRFLAPVTRRDAAAPEGGPARGPSIAVLPFANLSGDPEQEHFADGLAEDIITRLSHVRALFVSARDSSFAWKGRPTDLKAIGRELGVRYVLGGSVRRAGQRLRTTALLNDAGTGLQVWAEQYDGDVADFFALQDRITESVIAAIEPQIYAAEHARARSRPPESLDAWG